jgi:hypothetical protein
VDFRPVTVTGSEAKLQRPRGSRDYWKVPKKDLIFPLVAAFQQRRVRIAKGVEHKDTLAEELRNYKRKVNIATGNLTFEPWREREHDDLLFAASLAYFGWVVPQYRGNPYLRLVDKDGNVTTVGASGTTSRD